MTRIKGWIVTLTEIIYSIFIFEGDPMTVLSQKYFLETYDHSVEIVDMEYFEKPVDLRPADIVLLDIALENPVTFPVLDVLLKSQTRPKLLLTAFEDQIFRGDDFLSGGPAQILFKPFSPNQLIAAVTELADMSHA